MGTIGRRMLRRSGGGVPGISKVTNRIVKMNFVANLDNIQDSLDQLTETVAAGEVLYLQIWHYVNGVDGPVSLAQYVFKNNQATTVFNPGNPIQAVDLIAIGELYDLTGTITAESTQLIELGDISPETISEYVNHTGPYEIQEPGVGDRIFSNEKDGVTSYYYFLPAGGDYGDGQTPTIDANFAPFDTTAKYIPTLGEVLMRENRIVEFKLAPYEFVAEDKAKSIVWDDNEAEKFTLEAGIFNVNDELELIGYGNQGKWIVLGENIELNSGGAEYYCAPKNTVFLKFIFQDGDTEIWRASYRKATAEPQIIKGFIENFDIAEQAEGPLLKGGRYKIIDYVEGDDFMTSGADANANDVEFLANGDEPFWEYGSILEYMAFPILTITDTNCNIIPGTVRNGKGKYVATTDGKFTPNTRFVITSPDAYQTSVDHANITPEEVFFYCRNNAGYADRIFRTPFILEIPRD